MDATDLRAADPGLTGPDHLATYPMLDAMTYRRARRFALGDHLQGGAFSYRSDKPPIPLNLDEEAVLAFAGAGVTGRLTGELPYQPSAGPSAWRDPALIQSAIPEYSEANIQAVIAYCEYVMKHYGQFPANYGPLRTLMAAALSKGLRVTWMNFRGNWILRIRRS